jgi:hypothetical protein
MQGSRFITTNQLSTVYIMSIKTTVYFMIYLLKCNRHGQVNLLQGQRRQESGGGHAAVAGKADQAYRP